MVRIQRSVQKGQSTTQRNKSNEEKNESFIFDTSKLFVLLLYYHYTPTSSYYVQVQTVYSITTTSSTALPTLQILDVFIVVLFDYIIIYLYCQ